MNLNISIELNRDAIQKISSFELFYFLIIILFPQNKKQIKT